MDDYNSTSTSPMKLVMFLDAVEHVSKISRIIRQPGGHALLLGVGGSGRQSLSRLSSFMEEFDLRQIEISKNYGQTEWKEDLKRVLYALSRFYLRAVSPENLWYFYSPILKFSRKAV